MNEGMVRVGPAVPGGGSAPGPVDALTSDVLYRWWLDTRPGWTDPGWYSVALRPQVRALLGLPLGPELLTALTRLGSGESGQHTACSGDHLGDGLPGQPVPGSAPGFACACQVVVVAAWEAMASWTAARSAAELVSVAGGAPVVIPPAGAAPGITDIVREELAPACRLSPASMGLRITTARDLLAHPLLMDLVTEGVCSYWAARGVVQVVANLPEEAAEQVIAEVAVRARERNISGRRCWSSAEVRRAARVARLRLPDPADAVARATARRGRRVTVSPAGDGMAALIAILAEGDAHRIHARLTALAGGLDDPERTCDQKRADILTDVLLAAAAPAGSQPQASPAATDQPGTGRSDSTATSAGAVAPPRPEVCVVVSLATLLGLSQEPGELLGLGPIPADEARELAADGVWRAWITDAAGNVFATSSRRYTPSPALARLVRAREPYCRYPGCRRRSTNCDLDHTIPWGHPHSSTTAANLGPLCRRHHVTKTHYGHHLSNADPEEGGGWGWASPAGIEHDDGPEPPLR